MRGLNSGLSFKMAAQESIEYQTLIHCSDRLSTAFKNSLVSIADKLLAKGFIPSELHDNVLNSGLEGDKVKASKLVKCVMDIVSICPGRYYDFMTLKSFQEEWLKPIHAVLTTEYGE